MTALVIRDVRLFDGVSDRPMERATVTVLGRPDLGRIAPGAAADLVLVRGNPLRRLADSRAIAAVVVRGRLSESQTLLRKEVHP